MRLAVIACFLNEEKYLPDFLESLAAQEREHERMLLVDDGSSDASLAIAREYAGDHPSVRVLSRPQRARDRDRLALAAELEAFCWAAEQLDVEWDVVAKLDADLRLTAGTFAELERLLEADPGLGIVGALQSIIVGGSSVRERCPPGHVRGSTKFYRRACFEQIYPLDVRLGWDTTDEIQARMRGWRTQSFAMPDGDPVHLRPTATQDGAARGQRRIGRAAYAYGAGLGWTLLGTASRLNERPRLLGALNYLWGWVAAALRSEPRADAAQRAFLAREHRLQWRARVRGRLARHSQRPNLRIISRGASSTPGSGSSSANIARSRGPRNDSK